MSCEYKYGEGEICKVAKEGLWNFNKGERVIIDIVDRGDLYEPYLVLSETHDRSEWVGGEYLNIIENSIKKIKEN